MKIVVIDDHPLVRKGLASVLSLEPDNELVGEAENASQALEIIHKMNPDLALVDLRLKGEYGLDIIKKAKEKGFACKFVVLTSSADQSDFQMAKETGVEGYVLKEALPDELLYAIRLVLRGRKYYDPGLMEFAMNKQEDETVEKLTTREMDVLSALGQGLKNNDIAKKLFITEYTVKKHVSQILDKLGLADRTQAALYAHDRGFVKLS